MKTKLLLFLMTALLSFTQCKKDDNDGDNGNDLTTDIVGRYENPDDYDLLVIVNKVDDNTVSITLQNGYFDLVFNDVTMQSKTSFTLNEFIEDSANKYSGQGTNSINNISLNVKWLYNENEDIVNFIATKVN